MDSAALAGTASSCQHDFSRLSSFSPNHPLARAAASFTQDGLAAVSGGNGAHDGNGDTSSDAVEGVATVVSPAKVVAGGDVVVGGAAGVLLSTAPCGAPPGAATATAAGVGVDAGGAVAMRSHVGFTARNDGTPGKIYLDLDGNIFGVTVVHVSCRRAMLR